MTSLSDMRKSLRSLVAASLLMSLFTIAAPVVRVSALDPLSVPTFTVSRGTNPFLFKLNFTPDDRARYQVRAYFSTDNFLRSYVVNSDYTAGTDLSNRSDTSSRVRCSDVMGSVSTNDGVMTSYCSRVIDSQDTARFSLVVTNRSTSEVLPESAKSNAVGLLHGHPLQLVSGFTNATGTNAEAIRAQMGSIKGGTKISLAFRRSDNYAVVYRSVPNLMMSIAYHIQLPGGYRYKIDASAVGGVVNGVTWFDSDPEEIHDGFYVAKKPGPVTNIVGTPNSAGGIDVTWDSPSVSGGNPPEGYQIYVSTDRVNLLTAMENYVTAPATSVTISGLRSVSQSFEPLNYGTQYYILIRPTLSSPNMNSVLSYSARPVVPQVAPGTPPGSYSAGDSRINVTWSEPLFTGGVTPTAYEIQVSADGTTWTSSEVAGTATSGSIGGLTNGVQYSVRLRAKNTAGASGWDTGTATPVGIPTAVTEPVSAIGSTSARVSMSLNARGDNVNVALQYSLGSGAISTLPLGSTNSSSYLDGATLSNLLPGRMYRVRAVAQASDNNFYYGQWRTFTTTPSAPSNVSVATSSESVTVTWTTPDVAPTVLNYDIWAERNGVVVGSGCAKYTRVATSGSCVITGLTAGTLYDIRTSVTTVGADYGNATSGLTKNTITTKRPQSIVDKSNLLPKLYNGIADLSLSNYFPSDAGLTVSAVSATTSKCLIGPGPILSIRAAGTCTITVSQAGNSIFGPAESKTFSMTVADTQSISMAFNSMTSPKVGANPVDISSYASASSGLAVSFVSKTPTTCSTNGVNVSPLSAGECEIIGIQMGNDSYMPAPQKTASFMVAKGDQATLSITSTGGPFNQPITLQTSGGTGSGIVTYSLNSTGNTSNCSLTATGVKALLPGDCIVKATKATDANYTQVESQYKTLVFTKANQTITFVSIPDTLEGTVFNATATSTSGLTVTIQSLTTSVCTVTNSTVSLDHAGTCQLKASQSGTTSFNAATDVTVSFESNAKAIPQTGTLLYDRTRNYYIGDTINFSVAADVNGQQSEVPGTFTWFAETPGILEFDAQVPGRATIVSRSNAGGMVNVMYKFTPDTASSVLYNPALGGAALQVQLTPQPVSLTAQTVQYDQPAQMVVTGILGTGQVTYGLSPLDANLQNTSVRNSKCTVSGPVVTRSEPGTCVVRAMVASDSRYVATDAVREFVFAKKKQVLSIENTYILEQANYADRANTIDLTTMAVSSESLTPEISTTSSACSISAGVLTIVSAGQCEIKLTQSGNSTIETVSEYFFTFTIGKAPQPTVALAAVLASVSSPLQLSATGGTGNGSVSYVVTDGAATGCRMVNGALVADTAGSCLVEIVKGEDVNYAAVISSPEIVIIEKGTHTLNFSLTSLPTVRVGDSPFSLAGYAQLSSGQAASFVSGSPSVCTVSGAMVTVLASGQCIIDAEFAENESYLAVSAVTRYFSVQGPAAPTQTPVVVEALTSPTGVSLSRGTSKALIAKWQAPTSGVSSITTYIATLSPGGKRCMVATTTCTFTGLDATTKYSVSVVAVSPTTTSGESISSSVVPNIQVKVNGRTSLKSMITTTSKGTKKWTVTGGCKISGQTFVAASKAATCTLTLATAKFKTTPAATKRASIQVTK
ncbi:MAG: hypothetical protein RLZ18_957 [Actinomycetota bacterium]